MIIDLQDESAPAELTCDLCVVGTGAAGLALASKMLRTSLRVVLVESGGLDHEAATQALYDVDVSALPHRGATEGRFRVWGGSTTKWGGQALPMMPIDFEQREWVAHSGWPISFAEVAAHYDEACRFLRVDDMNFDSDLFSHLRTNPPPFDPERLWYHFSKWSPQPDLRRHWQEKVAVSSRCTLLLHANVTELRLHDDLQRMDSLSVRSLSGRAMKVRSRAFVLCAGGIETARLLLANTHQVPTGVGNQNDLVGRYFQDHVWADIGTMSGGDAAQKVFNVFHKRGLKYSVRCTAAPAWQRAHRTLNMSMQVLFLAEPASVLQDLKDVYVALRQRRLSPSLVRRCLRVMRHPASVLVPAWQYGVHGRSFAPGARIVVGVASEQEPNRDSRIRLSAETDALGMPRAVVEWKLTELTRHSLGEFARGLVDEFRRAGLGSLDVDGWITDGDADWTAKITDQFHHMGTARMHDSPKEGVTDRDCRVHGITNLFIGSSAVFPTGGHSNPTLTLIALCFRLASKLERELSA